MRALLFCAAFAAALVPGGAVGAADPLPTLSGGPPLRCIPA